MRSRKGIIAAIAAVVLLAGGWYWGSPWWTLWRMKEAAQARDADALSAYVDYDKLRETTKTQLRTQLMAQASKGGSGGQDGLNALGAAFGLALMGPMIDAMVTPEGLRLAFLKAPERAKEAGGKSAPLGADASDSDILRMGLHEFRLRQKGRKSEEGDLVFRRHGLGWKLEEIRIPKDLPAS